MTWKILPLDGKYYGTKIEGPGGVIIKVWGYRLWELSEREREKLGPLADVEDEKEWKSDGHYEDAGDYAVARVIVDALNAAKLPSIDKF